MRSPMKAYIGAAVDRYCRLAARTPASPVKMLTQRSGKIAMKVAIEPTETNAIAPAVQAIRRARAIPPRADRHADHRHRGDADRERDRGQHEFEPRADAVAGEDRGAETRQHVGEDADRQHRLQRREAGDRADLQDVEEHRPLNAKSPDPGNDARPPGEQIPAHHGDADRDRRSASPPRRRACRIAGSARARGRACRRE